MARSVFVRPNPSISPETPAERQVVMTVLEGHGPATAVRRILDWTRTRSRLVDDHAKSRVFALIKLV